MYCLLFAFDSVNFAVCIKLKFVMICINNQISFIIQITVMSSLLFKPHANVEISQNINGHPQIYNKGNETFGMNQSFSVGMRINFLFLKFTNRENLNQMFVHR